MDSLDALHKAVSEAFEARRQELKPAFLLHLVNAAGETSTLDTCSEDTPINEVVELAAALYQKRPREIQLVEEIGGQLPCHNVRDSGLTLNQLGIDSGTTLTVVVMQALDLPAE